MQTKIQYLYKIPQFLRRLNDVRFAGQLIFVVIVLMITWSGIKSVQTNYGLQRQISALKQQNNVQQLENSNLSLQNQYLNSNQYLELSARQNFGLADPGEKEIVVPQQVAASYTVSLPSDNTDTVQKHSPAYQQNFRSWIDFFLHRQDSST